MYFCYIIRSFDGEIVATVKEKKSIFRLQLIKNIAATVDIIKLCTRIIWAHHHIFIYLSILCDAMLKSFLHAFFLLQFSCINKRLICSFFRSLNISSGWNNLWHNELMKYYIICMYLFVLYTIVFTFYADSVTHRVRVYGIYFYQLIFFPSSFVVIADLFITTLIKAIIGEHNEKIYMKYEINIELMAIWQGAIAIIEHK